MLAIMNVWADVLSVIILFFAAGFCVFQIGGNHFTGRFRRKLYGKLWPKHKEIIPVLPRAIHGLHAISIVALAVSGINIRFPSDFLSYETMLKIHYFFMYPVVATFVLRIYYAIIKDAHEFKIHPSEVHHGFKVVLYYTFIKSSYPHLAKCNVFQKTTYVLFFPFLMIVLTASGFSLMWPSAFLGMFAGLFGSIPTAIAFAFVVHWVAAVSIIAMTMVH
ncbi:MAG: cytochrome b/b6 domain-containing protein, partial [Rubrobacteridae bacterium]|nr:cytochrome b/b6 domain-containing protein [Rubrobacteridae bacterium]